jgi:tripartite-type tricarboxylate transporter receptor subunit TctC
MRAPAIATFASGVAALVLASAAAAQSYPSKPLRMIVPFPPGGATDIIARVVAERLGASLGQSIIVENRPGAGGSIGSDLVAKAAPDGYTILMATTSTHSIGPALNPKLPYVVERDFAPVSHVATSPSVLIVGTSVPAANVRELIAAAKARPGRLTYGSSGTGTIVHLSGELFRSMADVDLVHIPYKGTQLAIPDIINGQIAMMFDNIVSALPHIRSGKVRALAMGGPKRSPLLPELPTVGESGLPGYVSDAYFGVFAPAATPREIVARLAGDIGRIVREPDVQMRFSNQGAEPVGGAPDAFAAVIRADTAKWTKVIRDANVRLD